MSAALTKKQYTLAEYAALELRTDRKYEYYRGEVFLMPGGTPEHSFTKVNLVRLLGNYLVDKPCALFDSDMRVKVDANGLYTYPDAAIACPPIEYDETLNPKSLANPVALFEVLSDSSANYDRGEKFNLYRELSSLKEYFLISQDAPLVKHRYRRDSEWLVQVVDRLESTICVESIAYDLSLRQLYANVEFPTRPEETEP